MATDAEKLAEAKVAYHSLLMGTMARVVVDQNGERVEFTAARRADLYAYIRELEGLVNPSEVVPPNGPLGFVF